MALIMEIMKTIAHPIGELAVWLEETYQVEISETVAKWRELTGMNITIKEGEGEVSDQQVQSLDVDSTKNLKTKKIPKTKDVCQHIFLSGQKVGEQCTTKPKGGASHCSAHKPKASAKSPKEPKKKEVKKIEKIDSEFESDHEQPKVTKEPKKEKVVEKAPPKKQKKTSGDTDMSEDSDGELIPREYKQEKLATQKAALKQLTLDDSDEEGSEPQKPVKPLLRKKKLNGPIKPSKQQYNTDEEILDKDLDLSDDN